MLFRELGSGEDAVLVLNGSASAFDHVLPLAEALARDHRVFVPRYPGYDGLPAQPGAYDLEAERVALEDALLAHGITSVRVVGVSLGAYRAFALAAAGRVKVERIVTLGAVVDVSPEDRAAFRGFAALARSRQLPPGLLSGRFLSPAFAAAHPEVVADVESWPSRLELDAVAAELEAVAVCKDLSPEIPRAAPRCAQRARRRSRKSLAPPASVDTPRWWSDEHRPPEQRGSTCRMHSLSVGVLRSAVARSPRARCSTSGSSS